MNAYVLAAFADELEKDAAAPQLLQQIKQRIGSVPQLAQKVWGHGAGRALTGAAVGAGAGAITAPPEERSRRMLLGGLLGAGAGYASPLLTAAGRAKAKEHAGYLGAKAKHEITGRGAAPVKPGASGKELAELRRAEASGLTSIPGVVKGMATHPLQTLKQSWKQTDNLGKVLAVGDVGLSVPHVMDQTTEAGTGEKVLGTTGRAAGYLLGGKMGLLGSTALGTGMGYLGGHAGRLFGGGQRGAVDMGPRAELVRQARPEVGRMIGIQ